MGDPGGDRCSGAGIGNFHCRRDPGLYCDYYDGKGAGRHFDDLPRLNSCRRWERVERLSWPYSGGFKKWQRRIADGIQWNLHEPGRLYYGDVE